MIVAYSEFFAERIHCVYLRFAHALDVHVHREAHVAVTQDRLNRFIVHSQRVEIGSEAPPEGVPAVPCESIVQLEHMGFGFVVRFGFPAFDALLDCWPNHPLGQIVEVQRLPGLQTPTIALLPSMRFQP